MLAQEGDGEVMVFADTRPNTGTQFACVTGTKVQAEYRRSLCLLYWYKRTNTDAAFLTRGRTQSIRPILAPAPRRRRRRKRKRGKREVMRVMSVLARRVQE